MPHSVKDRGFIDPCSHGLGSAACWPPMPSTRSTEKPSLCLALVGCVFAALLASDGTQILVLRLNSMLFFKEFI
ncbi:hypothetical protein EMIT0196MI5_120118 [Pseudomonas sp. IT-196MI5]